jgi:hypothetical protein
MTNADWWLRVRQQRDAVRPRQATDVELILAQQIGPVH